MYHNPLRLTYRHYASVFWLIAVLATILHVMVSRVHGIEIRDSDGNIVTSAKSDPVIHVLLIVDDADEHIGDSVKRDEVSLRNLFRYVNEKTGIPYNVSVLKSSVDAESEEFMSNRNILKWISGRGNTEDIVFVYYAGWGYLQSYSQEHVLRLPNELLYRKRLADVIYSLNCRLKILVTDADSIFSDGTSVTSPESSVIPEKEVNPHSPWLYIGTAYQHLFLEHEGFLDLTAAAKGEYAFATAGGGGIFTKAFGEALSQPGADHDGFASWDDGFASWDRVFEITKQRTHFYFSHVSQLFEGIKQQNQHPQFFGELPKRVTAESSTTR